MNELGVVSSVKKQYTKVKRNVTDVFPKLKKFYAYTSLEELKRRNNMVLTKNIEFLA